MKTKLLILLLFPIILSACFFESQDGPPTRQVDVTKIPNAVPKIEPKSIYGNPVSYEVNGQRYYVLPGSKGYHATGIASWYGTKFDGQLTSDRETYDMFKMTAAHKTLPLPTYAKVTNLENGRQIIVKINDRGPFENNRLIDLSYVAAKKLGILAKGTGLVEVDAIDPHQTQYIPFQNRSIKPNANPQIYLQVGAYSNQQNAEHMRQRLQNDLALAANIYEGYYQNHPIYRVKIGPLTNITEADRVTTRLESIGLPEPTTDIR